MNLEPSREGLAEEILALELREVPSPYFKARVRERIRHEPARARAWPARRFAAAAGTVLVAAILFAVKDRLVPGGESTTESRSSAPVTSSERVATVVPVEPPVTLPAAGGSRPTPAHRPREIELMRRPAEPAFPKVIVPAEQRAGLDLLAEAAADLPPGGLELPIREANDGGPPKPISIAAIAIDPLVIEPISGKSAGGEPPANL